MTEQTGLVIMFGALLAFIYGVVRAILRSI